jgi:hypothetical protein
MKKEDQILHELKTLSPAELEEVLTFIGYLKFRAATGEEEAPKSRPLDIGDA